MRAFRVAYDGRPFHGFQRQPDVPTVEGVLLDALYELDVTGAKADTPPRYAAAGRTDAGVSAVRQTVAFETPEWLTPRAFNGELPGTIRVWAHANVSDGFHATHDADNRQYVYYLYAPEDGMEHTSTTYRLDRDRLETALTRLSGSHDFHNLTPDTKGTERTISTDLRRDGAFLGVRVEAGGFPREFVRRLVTLCRGVAARTAPLEKVDRVLAPEPLPGPEGIGPAPPGPLILWDVTYGLDFQKDPVAAVSACDAFADRQTTAAAAAKMTAEIRGQIAESR